MANWTLEGLKSIGSTDDFHISPFRADGTTLGTPTWIWSVVVDGALYVRAYHGPHIAMVRFRPVAARRPITAGGVGKDVSFVPADETWLNYRIDDAYWAKYAGSPYLPPSSPTGSSPPPCV